MVHLCIAYKIVSGSQAVVYNEYMHLAQSDQETKLFSSSLKKK